MRLIKTIYLELHRDTDSGIWGLVPKGTTDGDNRFNSFWDPRGIFHDTFEHNFENTHKYFKNDYALNLGGELAAMGALWYYYSEMGFSKRMGSMGSYSYSPGDSMRNTTLSEIREICHTGWHRYGEELLSAIPYQKPVDNVELEYQIRKYWEEVKKLQPESDSEQDIDFANSYLKSVSLQKIANLHRWGYRMAQRLVPDKKDNYLMLEDFYDTMTKLTRLDAEHIYNLGFSELVIKLYRKNSKLDWKAKLMGESVKSVNINKLKRLPL